MQKTSNESSRNAEANYYSSHILNMHLDTGPNSDEYHPYYNRVKEQI